MQTVEIPRPDWARALGEFSAIHRGWLISVDVLSLDLGAQPAIDNRPLAGTWADPAGTIGITTGRTAAEHTTHYVRGVNRVSIERTDEGADVALGLESSDGTRTTVRFRVAALPETVDGLARVSLSRRLRPYHGGSVLERNSRK